MRTVVSGPSLESRPPVPRRTGRTDPNHLEVDVYRLESGLFVCQMLHRAWPPGAVSGAVILVPGGMVLARRREVVAALEAVLENGGTEGLEARRIPASVLDLYREGGLGALREARPEDLLFDQSWLARRFASASLTLE